MNVCKRCGVSKPEDAFYLNKGYREGTCNDCKKKRTLEWTRANRDKVSAYARKMRKENPEAVKVREMRARAKRKSSMTGTITDLTTDQWKATLAYFDNGCAVCRNSSEIHMDHFIPVASGSGDTTVNNVIPLCARHNVSKSNKHPLNWLSYESGASVDTVERIIAYLAQLNGMHPSEYENYVIDRYYGIESEFDNDSDYYIYSEDLSLYDADNFIYDDDDWYLTILNGRRW